MIDPGECVLASVRGGASDRVGASVWDRVWFGADARVWASVRNSVWDRVWFGVGDRVWASLEEES